MSEYDRYLAKSFLRAAERLGSVSEEIQPHRNQGDSEDEISRLLAELDPTLVVDQGSASLPGLAEARVRGLIVRHYGAGVAERFASCPLVQQRDIAIINAGAEGSENPTEALLYLYVICTRVACGSLENLNTVIVGDLVHEPVGRSLVFGLSKLGLEVHFVGPESLIENELRDSAHVRVHETIDSVPRQNTNVIISIPIWPEAFGALLSRDAYREQFSIRGDICHAPNTVLLGCRPAFEDCEIPLIWGDRKASSRGEPAETLPLTVPTVMDELVVRMAALAHCLEP